ncbi:hypothetical protein GCM10022403_081200 [Streptomyces coacervatus]|uniref:Uncharacterized protein n=1 Tax=Streptomyces coacervatus TaxID=647381 RepID=A0ABP7J7Q4_9ACTN
MLAFLVISPEGSKQGPELLERRLALYGEAPRMVFGADTYRAFARALMAAGLAADFGLELIESRTLDVRLGR